MNNFLSVIKKIKTPILLLVCFLAVFGIGYFTGKNAVVCNFCAPENVNFSLFWEAWDTVSKDFVDPSKLDSKKMTYGAISGMIKALGDPYTSFFSPDDTKSFLEEVSGSFEGIGMEISVKKNQLQIVSPIENTPAQKAGLRAGDKILKINDKYTTDMTAEEAVSLIRGPQGTEVALNILREEWSSPKEFKIKRAVIEVPSLTWKILNNGKEDVAYIKLYHFNEKADSDFPKIAFEIEKSSAKKIIIDLRNNPGGYLEVSQRIASWFLERGQTVVIEDFGGKKEDDIFKATGNPRLLGYPIVVLINEGSASASEILAAALRDNISAKLVGKTSFGKGSVQQLMDLSDNSSIKITIAKWLTPKRVQINEKGLTPDIEIDITEEDINSGKDPQLDKALEIIKEIK